MNFMPVCLTSDPIPRSEMYERKFGPSNRKSVATTQGNEGNDDKQELVMGYIVHNLTDAGEE